MTIAYITKYALTHGIYKIKGEVIGDMFKRPPSAPGSFTEFFHGMDWHLTAEDAIARAEEVRIKKLQSLDKQIKKISALKFEIK